MFFVDRTETLVHLGVGSIPFVWAGPFNGPKPIV